MAKGKKTVVKDVISAVKEIIGGKTDVGEAKEIDGGATDGVIPNEPVKTKDPEKGVEKDEVSDGEVLEGEKVKLKNVAPADFNGVQIQVLPNYCGESPCFAKEGDAGLDLINANETPVTVKGSDGKVTIVPTGIAVAIPEGYCGLIMERSGLGVKYGIKLHGRVIDSGYRGEVKVIMSMSANKKVTFAKGDRVAQIVFVPCMTETTIVDELPVSERGEDGLGSTGK